MVGFWYLVYDGIDVIMFLEWYGVMVEFWLGMLWLDVISGLCVGVVGVVGIDVFFWCFWIDGDFMVLVFCWGRGVVEVVVLCGGDFVLD